MKNLQKTLGAITIAAGGGTLLGGIITGDKIIDYIGAGIFLGGAMGYILIRDYEGKNKF